ncbi:ester cyclase [Occallatibacter riparius]|uniref:Nuclear transport factor 2 family protein n=1 Tax=Occallatibacter riparius TaxID=1002689 RepID=A0A9J7BHE9_9BACT|nr:nuclear transport factor 2 family protein [Occallatibacter riparius]UWZ82388.1 nuclear transport factor 2 family protein [Occallatibacter riparius]
MSGDVQDTVGVAQRFVDAINRQDVNAVANLMTPDHLFTDSLGNVARGRESMREGWKLYFQMVPDYQLQVEETYVNESAVVMLGIAGGTYSHGFESVRATGMPMVLPDGTSKLMNKWQTPAAVRARIEDGLVAEWQVFADNEPIRKLMRGEDGANPG